MTIASVIDRAYRDYLQPPGEQPSRFVVDDTGGISDSDTSVITDTSLLNPEEEDLIAAGTLIEIESELILVEAVSGTSPAFTLTIRRGMYGTTAAAHADGTEIVIASDDHVPRYSVFTAVADSIDNLWPDLWTVAVEETFASTDPIELPADVGEVLDVLAQNGSRWRRGGSWTELQDFPLFASERGLQLDGVVSGTSLQVYYKKKPTRPTAETDALTDLGVETSWVKLIVVSAVAQIAARTDLSKATVDFITQALEAEASGPAGTGADIRNALLQFESFLMEPLKRQQALKQHGRIVVDTTYA